jgi:hypothetical protein
MVEAAQVAVVAPPGRLILHGQAVAVAVAAAAWTLAGWAVAAAVEQQEDSRGARQAAAAAVVAGWGSTSWLRAL